MASWQRTHTCGELREEHIGQEVVLNGWVHTFRDHNVFIFVDLRDRYGLTQVVFEPDRGEELFQQARKLRSEYVISVRGKVVRRLEGKENPDLPTGAIEVKAEALTILNKCPTPPFEVTEFAEEEIANEDLRLKYRYLDLRRRSLQRILALRHTACKAMRDYLDSRGFLEIETPLLGRSTPEGARDYLVPSRLFPGQWYALPQSPQLYKQLLMIAGYDKYFQIARCLRDEDLRANRQPEFTQLDLEMSFVEQDDIFDVIEGLTVEVFRRCLDVEVPRPFPRIAWHEAMRRYGTDKPDLRFEMEIVDVSDIVAETEFRVFRETLQAGGVVRGLNAKGASERYTRKKIDELTRYAQTFGAKGLLWAKIEPDSITSPIEKFLSPQQQAELRQRMAAEPGDLLLFVADQEQTAALTLGNLRNRLGAELELYDPKSFRFAWIVEFPLFAWDDEENRWVSMNHPFTAPADEDIPLLESDPAKVRSKAYDLAINGMECGGGSIRIHSPELQEKVFGALGMTREQGRERFGFLLDALTYGAPPHGGIALGIDRWIMTLAGTDNIRDVIAFPKNQRARDLMTGAPAIVDDRQLRELGIYRLTESLMLQLEREPSESITAALKKWQKWLSESSGE